jgi:hypothetical protein
VSGDNVVRQWAIEARLVSTRVAWIVLIALTMVGCAAIAEGVCLTDWLYWTRWQRIEMTLIRALGSARSWLLLAAWVQTGLTIVWALGSREVFAEGWRRPRILAARTQVTVQAVFIVMAALITLLVLQAAR